jgi:hypothetical protein
MLVFCVGVMVDVGVFCPFCFVESARTNYPQNRRWVGAAARRLFYCILFVGIYFGVGDVIVFLYFFVE